MNGGRRVGTPTRRPRPVGVNSGSLSQVWTDTDVGLPSVARFHKEVAKMTAYDYFPAHRQEGAPDREIDPHQEVTRDYKTDPPGEERSRRGPCDIDSAIMDYMMREEIARPRYADFLMMGVG